MRPGPRGAGDADRGDARGRKPGRRARKAGGEPGAGVDWDAVRRRLSPAPCFSAASPTPLCSRPECSNRYLIDAVFVQPRMSLVNLPGG